MQDINNKSSQAHSTVLVLLNTRTMKGYKSVEEMLKPVKDKPSVEDNHQAPHQIKITTPSLSTPTI